MPRQVTIRIMRFGSPKQDSQAVEPFVRLHKWTLSSKKKYLRLAIIIFLFVKEGTVEKTESYFNSIKDWAQENSGYNVFYFQYFDKETADEQDDICNNFFGLADAEGNLKFDIWYSNKISLKKVTEMIQENVTCIIHFFLGNCYLNFVRYYSQNYSTKLGTVLLRWFEVAENKGCLDKYQLKQLHNFAWVCGNNWWTLFLIDVVDSIRNTMSVKCWDRMQRGLQFLKYSYSIREVHTPHTQKHHCQTRSTSHSKHSCENFVTSKICKVSTIAGSSIVFHYLVLFLKIRQSNILPDLYEYVHAFSVVE